MHFKLLWGQEVYLSSNQVHTGTLSMCSVCGYDHPATAYNAHNEDVIASSSLPSQAGVGGSTALKTWLLAKQILSVAG